MGAGGSIARPFSLSSGFPVLGLPSSPPVARGMALPPSHAVSLASPRIRLKVSLPFYSADLLPRDGVGSTGEVGHYGRGPLRAQGSATLPALAGSS